MQGRLFTIDLSFLGGNYVIPRRATSCSCSRVVFATLMGAIWAKRIGQDPDVIVDLGFGDAARRIAGGRLLHVFADGYFWDYVHLCTDPSKVSWHLDARSA